ncbi:MAG: alpha/beta hydrolase [Bacteroidales bacterium]
MNRIVPLLVSLALLAGCTKEKEEERQFEKGVVDLGTHSLRTYALMNDRPNLVVLEAGLGDDHSVWLTLNLAEALGDSADVLIYDRGGYGESTLDDNPRNIERLRSELEAVVNPYAESKNLILVGHSLGGLIIRDFAINHPESTTGLLFLDPSHEAYNQPTQDMEDLVVDAFSDAFGPESGGAREAEQLVEDFAFAADLLPLPDVPVIVLTSMKEDQANTLSDQTYHKTRDDWYQAHELLGTGVTDFTHIPTTESGHYIMKDEPDLVVDQIQILLSKLPLK